MQTFADTDDDSEIGLAAALKTKGCHYRYVFSKASGHVDGRVVGATLPDALLRLWRGAAAK